MRALFSRGTGGLRADEITGIGPNLAIHVIKIDSITHQAAGCGELAKGVHRGHGMSRCQGSKLVAARIEKRIGGNRERRDAVLRNGIKGRLDLAS
jgi:hypothetical protein